MCEAIDEFNKKHLDAFQSDLDLLRSGNATESDQGRVLALMGSLLIASQSGIQIIEKKQNKLTAELIQIRTGLWPESKLQETAEAAAKAAIAFHVSNCQFAKTIWVDRFCDWVAKNKKIVMFLGVIAFAFAAVLCKKHGIDLFDFWREIHHFTSQSQIIQKGETNDAEKTETR